MSDQEKQPEPQAIDLTKLYECSMCGKPGVSCDQCGERAGVQERHYTLSELRAMSHEERERIVTGDRPSGSAPRIDSTLPGSL